jgi:hypothetical protein
MEAAEEAAMARDSSAARARELEAEVTTLTERLASVRKVRLVQQSFVDLFVVHSGQLPCLWGTCVQGTARKVSTAVGREVLALC